MYALLFIDMELPLDLLDRSVLLDNDLLGGDGDPSNMRERALPCIGSVVLLGEELRFNKLSIVFGGRDPIEPHASENGSEVLEPGSFICRSLGWGARRRRRRRRRWC